jgi:nucleoside-diphosphate-sugar epimerase
VDASIAQRLAAAEHRIAVTGATGWFGRVTLDLLAVALGAEAFHARVDAYAGRPREIEVAGVGPVEARSLDELRGADWILHYAFRTRDCVAELGAEEYVAANLAITRRMLDVLEQGKVGGLFYTSSGAAATPDLDANPYGALKRLDELALGAACEKAEATCVIARVFNVSGPHMTKPHLYALGDLILRAHAEQPLEVRARGSVIRSYVAVEDVVQLAFVLLLDGASASFNTVGDRVVEVEELADVVRTALGRPELPIERRRDPSAPEDRYVGDGQRIAELATHYGLEFVPLDEQVRATARSLS